MSHTIVHQLSVNYTGKHGVTQALSQLSIELMNGEILAVVGPSGCGKSTLLRVLAGVITQYEGQVLINDQRPNPKKHVIGWVPQNYALLPWKRVEQNIYFPATIGKYPIDHQLAQNIIRNLDLESLLHRYPNELSGGQQQRVALARAFIQRPDILLMDEPFSALDMLTAERSRILFSRVWNENPVSTLLVTHNIDEAATLCTHVAVLSASPGRVIDVLYKPSAHEIRKLIQTEWT